MLNLRRLKYREKIFLGFTAEIRVHDFSRGNGRRKTPVSRFLIKRNIVFLSGVNRLLLILVVVQLFFQITFTPATGSGLFPVNAKGCGDIVFIQLEVQENP